MTPFLQFRVWLMRGPTAERVPAAAASLLLLALIAWFLVPVRDESSTAEVTAGTVAPSVQPAVGAEGANGTAPQPSVPANGGASSSGPAPSSASGGAGGSGGGTGSGSGGGAAAGADRCADLRATDQGVSPTEVFVAVPLINLGGDVGNDTFGIRRDLEAVVQAAAAGVNDEGGVACRKLRLKTYRVNPLDQNEVRAKCIEIVGDKPFAVIDLAGFNLPADRACFPRNKIPYEGSTSLSEDEAAAAYPYMYSILVSTERALRNWVYEAAARGSFDPRAGFRKLGILLDACFPKANAGLEQGLRKVGLGADKVSLFTMSCTPIGPPSEISQAVVQHHNRDDVSHVLLATTSANAQNYLRAADGVRWKPGYMVSDYFGTLTHGSFAGNWTDGFDGAVGITSARSGEPNSGMVHSELTRCQNWMKRKNVPPPVKDGDAAVGFCSLLRVFVAAANAAGPNLVRARLLDDGLAKVGRIPLASVLDNIYDRPGKVFGGDFVRAVQWHRDCKCWKVLDPAEKPGH